MASKKRSTTLGRREKKPTPAEVVRSLLGPGDDFISVDPGSETGIVSWTYQPPTSLAGIHWWAATSLHVMSKWEPHEAISVLERKRYRRTVVFIEDQFLGMNPQSMIHTVLRRGFITCAASYHGLPVQTMTSSAWQTVLRRQDDKGRLDRDTLKRRSRLLALEDSREVSFVGKGEDACDAYGLGYFVRKCLIGGAS